MNPCLTSAPTTPDDGDWRVPTVKELGVMYGVLEDMIVSKRSLTAAERGLWTRNKAVGYARAARLIAGEIDYMQYLPFDMLPVLEKEKNVKLLGLGGLLLWRRRH